ncbi:hypothetical protein FEM48_Zijuj07G0057600 [Ziziphus jujuba var. spinosa]|uniref:rRNA adenine N(6)-methyltransferase n=1 Tax=Ziziphus jujuba var. spinosa TaxID=714518 RepID=A0A978V2T7_ZIZJJ|nr:hypothetical protein FEM48_Zijuj07G0057600 [Ziziphus jujuba var. spinosa]
MVDTIVQKSRIKSTNTILEIGPGTGILTKKLLGVGKLVITIEINLRVVLELKRHFQGTPLSHRMNDFFDHFTDVELRTTNEGADNPQSKDSTAAAILADDPKQEPLPSTTGTHMMEGDLTRNGKETIIKPKPRDTPKTTLTKFDEGKEISNEKSAPLQGTSAPPTTIRNSRTESDFGQVKPLKGQNRGTSPVKVEPNPQEKAGLDLGLVNQPKDNNGLKGFLAESDEVIIAHIGTMEDRARTSHAEGLVTSVDGASSSTKATILLSTAERSQPLFRCLSKLTIENCPKLDSMPLYPNLDEVLKLNNSSLEPLRQTMRMSVAGQQIPTTTAADEASTSTISNSVPSTRTSSPLSKLRNLCIVGMTELDFSTGSNHQIFKYFRTSKDYVLWPAQVPEHHNPCLLSGVGV